MARLTLTLEGNGDHMMHLIGCVQDTELIVPQQLSPTTACVAANLPGPHYPFCSSNPRVRYQRAENNYLFFFPLQSNLTANLTP